jgi:TfoX/Sxy family transcriptional regulator of competence genes
MGHDQETADRVRRVLAARSGVVEKRMVGGISFNVNGAMCCGVTTDGLVVRVGPAALERTLTEPHVRPMEFAGRRLAGFVRVDPAGCATEAELATWIQRGIDFASTTVASRLTETKPPRGQAQ